ncbi:spermidine/putrescine ABC transporter [Haematobacter massiliensis]|uniref:Spermidine/putrescine ABC transporter n=1 Tax=Haematobacter massiliensis TaxID=195105 RepID=A0A086YBR4_9RHOB|nr:ABC transporter permease [Haematobacter massiliensis]KFI31714.1 spermidine/putrescine ABC transporter [Haematobacter massiliensis]OWJ72100.1 spermidine/putrescine ABC transporter [Haematobacter massiliensis]OWJ87671.1 spermidine/putrescine ABC transporter [Haematobacter massiliensis]QBJ24108.1 ABC transporter permease [Haematobacter massiliensis]
MKAGGLRLYAYLYLLFLYAPIILLPLFAFNDGTIIAFPLNGFTTKWFDELWTIPALHQAVKNSLIIAISSAVFSTMLGIFAARAITRYDFPGKAAMSGLIMLPLVLPEVIVAVSLLVVLLAMGIPLAFWTVIFGHVLICTPYAVAILSSAFSSLDRSLEEAAIDLGETRMSTFRLVTLPLVAPGIVSSLLIGFTISLDEFIIAYFLTGSEPTLPVYIFSQFRFPAKVPVVMALGTILVILSVVLLTLAEMFRRRGVRRRGGVDTGGFL